MNSSISLLVGLLGVPVYAYAGYPALLKAAGAFRSRRSEPAAPDEWPMISITVPAYNEEAQIRGLIESLLQLDYPADRRQILIVSDASTDGTDAIVAEYADRGVELLRVPVRGGKGAAERAAHPCLRGEIIVNTDASIRIDPASLKPLIRQFTDPTVGLASGRDISVGSRSNRATEGESGYVGYEMWVRRLETALGGIIGASGCYYAIRADLHRAYLPHDLSRDFAAALIVREHGYRSVSVDAAVCYVPRSTSLHREYRRKVRTIARGLQTLAHKRHLLNPLRHGIFSWMLFSHKLCRWAVPWAALGTGVVVGGLAITGGGGLWARALFAATAGTAALALVGWKVAETRPLPRLLSIPAFVAAANVATLHAWVVALKGTRNAVWEPTRREALKA